MAEKKKKKKDMPVSAWRSCNKEGRISYVKEIKKHG